MGGLNLVGPALADDAIIGWCKALMNATAQHVQVTRPSCAQREQGAQNVAAAAADPLAGLNLWGYDRRKAPVFLSSVGEDWWFYANHARYMTRRGVYVDLATKHPVVISNTFFLDRCLGWKGLCIEPNPVHHSRIRQVRSCSLVDKVMTGPYSPHTVTMTSTVGASDKLGGRTHVGSPTPKDRSRYPRHKLQQMSVPADTLRNTLALHGITHIDFLSLDVEGHETEALRGFSWANVTVDVIVCEDSQAAAAMVEHGYRKVAYTDVPNHHQAFYLRAGFVPRILRPSAKSTAAASTNGGTLRYHYTTSQSKVLCSV